MTRIVAKRPQQNPLTIMLAGSSKSNLRLLSVWTRIVAKRPQQNPLTIMLAGSSKSNLAFFCMDSHCWQATSIDSTCKLNGEDIELLRQDICGKTEEYVQKV